jgi:hypothetical protein
MQPRHLLVSQMLSPAYEKESKPSHTFRSLSPGKSSLCAPFLFKEVTLHHHDVCLKSNQQTKIIPKFEFLQNTISTHPKNRYRTIAEEGEEVCMHLDVIVEHKVCFTVFSKKSECVLVCKILKL